MENNSPWLAQLTAKLTRAIAQITGAHSTDIAVVGGGIAGVTTAYFILKNTDKKVILIEAGKIAHGATGHNAGQLVSYFERQISDIVEEFGLKLAAEGQKAVDSSWGLLEEICEDAKISAPLYQFTGYAGCTNLDEVVVHLKNSMYSTHAGINNEQLMIAEESGLAAEIAREFNDEFKGLYVTVPHKDILALLETHNASYIAAISARKGCMNSALFTEELVQHLLRTYPERFVLTENTLVTEVRLENGSATLAVKAKKEQVEAKEDTSEKIETPHQVTAARVVLCTNGFEHFSIVNAANDNGAGASPDATLRGDTNSKGEPLNTQFHHMIHGSVGYMAAYLSQHDASPTAISYLPDKKSDPASALQSDPYFYITRRPFENEKNEKHNLISVGGPEAILEHSTHYVREHPYPEEAQKQIDHFLHRTYAHAPKGTIDYKYKWHGLMGYTPNGVRVIGPEPLNPALLYNLGCNGVGILPSIYGSQKISWFLAGRDLPPSIFDPKDFRVKK